MALGDIIWFYANINRCLETTFSGYFRKKHTTNKTAAIPKNKNDPPTQITAWEDFLGDQAQRGNASKGKFLDFVVLIRAGI